MDESPHGVGVMEGLAGSGYVKKFADKPDLGRFLKGAAPVLCRLTLITTENYHHRKERTAQAQAYT